jgi:DNA topoisomerase I
LSLGRVVRPPYTLVVCEKPDVARRIAQALGTSQIESLPEIVFESPDLGERKARAVAPVFWAMGRENIPFVVCSAIGHLYGLVDPKGKRSEYPIFDVIWRPISIKKTKGTDAKKFPSKQESIIRAISILSQKATRFVHACDYDQEGEVIGYNILRFACGNKYESSQRAKFSTLTDDEIRNSFDNLLKPSRGLADAGVSRHVIDFIYGVNLSRALTQSYKVSNDNKKYYNLTIGRVQGPTLAFVVDREIDIRKHIPIPYWTISAEFIEKTGNRIRAEYFQHKVATLAKARSIVNACTNQAGKVTDISNQNITINPPHPFNLGDLQNEAYRVFKFSPSYTLSLAEKLYISALISYPRTSSQKLPSSINYTKIISGVSNIRLSSTDVTKPDGNNHANDSIHRPYEKLGARLLSKKYLAPNEGSKNDPAHPAIYPTGEQPKRKLEATEFKIFDLIIRRFLATFGDAAKAARTSLKISVRDEHIFVAEEQKMVYEGWMYFYAPYSSKSLVSTGRDVLQMLKVGDILKNHGVFMIEKFSQPAVRFNQASLLEKMEQEKIGTKATRSEIIATLLKRNYISTVQTKSVSNKQDNKTPRITTGIEATDLGFELVQSMRKYSPEIVSVQLTRSIEEQLEGVEFGKTTSESVTAAASNNLKKAIVSFKGNEMEIGSELSSAISASNKKPEKPLVLGKCPLCNTGDLSIIRSSLTKKRFVGCSNYATGVCKATAQLPQKGPIKFTGKKCGECGWPIITTVYIKSGRHSWTFCINSQCPSKKRRNPKDNNNNNNNNNNIK